MKNAVPWSLSTGRWLPGVLLALVLALLPLSDAALLVGLGGVAILALINPIWALYAAVLSVPVQELVHLPGGVSYTQMALLLTAGSWTLRILAYPQRPVAPGRLAPALFVLVWVLFLSTLFTPYSQVEGFKETLRWITVVLVYLVTRNTLLRSQNNNNDGDDDDDDDDGAAGQEEHAKWPVVGLAICLLLATTASAVLGLWQFAAASGPPSFLIADGRFARSYGTIGQPNSFAGYMNMGWPLAVGLAVSAIWSQRQRRFRSTGPRTQNMTMNIIILGSGLSAVLILAALLTSLSRGGWIGALGGGAALLVAGAATLDRVVRVHIWRWGGVLVAGVLTGVALANAGVLPGTLAQRLSSITQSVRLFDVRDVAVNPLNFAVVERMSHLQAGGKMFIEHPLTGVGPGNYSLAYEGKGAFQAQPYTVHPWYTSRGHAHNYYLHIAAESGIGGFLAYMLLLGLLVRQARATARSTQHWFARGIAMGCCGIIGAVAVHNLFENLHVLNMGVQLGAVWGLLEVAEKI